MKNILVIIKKQIKDTDGRMYESLLEIVDEDGKVRLPFSVPAEIDWNRTESGKTAFPVDDEIIVPSREMTISGESTATATPEPTEETYDAEENVIDVVKYATTILEESEDAGQEYIESTLFLGDSNTARFLKVADSTGHSFTTRQNTIGVVGMGIDAIASLPCMDFYTGRYTMPQAVKILQPERVIITFGTNNLSGTSTDATSFIERYTKQIQAVQNAYPSVDIIVNSIPPVAQRRDYINVSMTQIDAFNKAIETLLVLLNPFSPHLTEELWNQLGHEDRLYGFESDAVFG